MCEPKTEADRELERGRSAVRDAVQRGTETNRYKGKKRTKGENDGGGPRDTNRGGNETEIDGWGRGEQVWEKAPGYVRP